ncbi:MAG TPA: CCA tRNA nucleotidyltransferase [Terriglobia bacterium]|jgi:poly(A) polymerase|nr:CCA tRNA nucleotidyltransferase [Terriglobia bacterium]
MDPRRAAARAIVDRLRSAGFQALWAGGCVRDLVMGREPKDYDVATDATPSQVIELFPDGLMVGAQFGVIAVPGQGFVTEVATFRSDGLYVDGRHPAEVRYARTPQQDVLRRDFTINGLLFDPQDDRVLDFVGGQADIRARRLRTIGNPRARFAEDRLRMLRAVRFAARLDFVIEPATFEAIRELAPTIHEVSAERIRDELLKILTEGGARRGFELLDQTLLLEEVLPQVKKLQGVEQPPEFHPEGDVWTHTLMMLEGLGSGPTPSTATLALGVLLHDIGKPSTFAVRERIRFDGHVEVGVIMAQEIGRGLKLSSRDNERVVELVAQHMRFKDFLNMRRSTQLKFLALDGFEEHLELHRLDCLASHGDLTIYEAARRMLQETPPEVIRPQPLVTGHDLIALGYTPGPLFKQMLDAVRDAQLEGRITTQVEGLAMVREKFPAPAAPAGSKS